MNQEDLLKWLGMQSKWNVLFSCAQIITIIILLVHTLLGSC